MFVFIAAWLAEVEKKASDKKTTQTLLLIFFRPRLTLSVHSHFLSFLFLNRKEADIVTSLQPFVLLVPSCLNEVDRRLFLNLWKLPRLERKDFLAPRAVVLNLVSGRSGWNAGFVSEFVLEKVSVGTSNRTFGTILKTLYTQISQWACVSINHWLQSGITFSASYLNGLLTGEKWKETGVGISRLKVIFEFVFPIFREQNSDVLLKQTRVCSYVLMKSLWSRHHLVK